MSGVISGSSHAFLYAQYDWTTGAPDNRNEWRKFRVVLRLRPCVPWFSTLFNRGGNRRAFSLIDFQGKVGITSIVRWDLCPVIFGVKFHVIHSVSRNYNWKAGILCVIHGVGHHVDKLWGISFAVSLHKIYVMRPGPLPKITLSEVSMYKHVGGGCMCICTTWPANIIAQRTREACSHRPSKHSESTCVHLSPEGLLEAPQLPTPTLPSMFTKHERRCSLAHRNRSDLCDLRLRCPSRTPEIARFPRQEKAMLHCDLRVR